MKRLMNLLLFFFTFYVFVTGDFSGIGPWLYLVGVAVLAYMLFPRPVANVANTSNVVDDDDTDFSHPSRRNDFVPSNPSTGFTMGIAGVDTAGNPYGGTNSSSMFSD